MILHHQSSHFLVIECVKLPVLLVIYFLPVFFDCLNMANLSQLIGGQKIPLFHIISIIGFQPSKIAGAGFRWPIHSIMGIDCKPHCGYPNGLLEILHMPLRNRILTKSSKSTAFNGDFTHQHDGFKRKTWGSKVVHTASVSLQQVSTSQNMGLSSKDQNSERPGKNPGRIQTDILDHQFFSSLPTRQKSFACPRKKWTLQCNVLGRSSTVHHFNG